MDDTLDREIARLTSTLRWHSAIIGAGWGIATALVAGLIATLVARQTPWLYQAELLLVLIWLLGTGALLGTILGYAWPRPLRQRLHLFDRRNTVAGHFQLGLQHGIRPDDPQPINLGVVFQPGMYSQRRHSYRPGRAADKELLVQGAGSDFHARTDRRSVRACLVVLRTYTSQVQ